MLDFSKDIENHIIEEFNCLDIDYKLRGDLDADLMNLYTVNKKYIYPWPRKVFISTELQSKIDKGIQQSTEILSLKTKIENGENVNRHQSSELFNHHVNDHLVYDWSIYHLHLSSERTKDDYFNDRTKKILFSFIDKERALFLDIDKHPPHDVFANKKLLQILDNNWPDILLIANDVQGPSHNMNKSVRFILRKAGVNEGLIEVNGKCVFSPGLGIVSNGQSSEVRLMLNQLNKWLKINTTQIIDNEVEIAKILKKKHTSFNSCKFRLLFEEEGPIIIEENTNTSIIKYPNALSL